jgi:Base plate wedge protein 53
MAIYSKSSPYFTTPLGAGYLDFINFRNITSYIDDIQYELSTKYEYRPDLLAFDLYSDPKLWWVFAVRNKDTLRDPIFDMVPGKVIYLPKITTLRSELGI